MKKLVYIFAVLFLGITSATAQKLVIEDCDAYAGAVTTIPVKYVTEGAKCSGGQLNIELPEGLSFVMTTESGGDGPVEVADAEVGAEAQGFYLVKSSNGFAVFGTSILPGEEGTLLKFKIQADADLEIGKQLKCRVYNVAVPTTDGNVKNEEFFFTVTIVENRITLDETVGITSETPTGTQNVLVKRTIKAGNWGTICLPFNVSADQMTDVFGAGVELATLKSLELSEEFDEDDNPLGILVHFESASSIEKNVPYIIKVGEDIASFTLDNVTIDPDEVYVSVGKKSQGTFGTFNGSYTPIVLESGSLFLNGNNFWYSTGKSKMKGFRAYFAFQSVVSQFSSNAKIGIIVDGESTSIDGIPSYQRITEGVYDLSGRKIKLEDGDVTKLQKGVYIIDGKKVTIK